MVTGKDFVIRRLVPGEGAGLRRLRRAGLENAPHAFISSVEDEVHLTDADFDERLASLDPDATFGVVSNGELVGMARLVTERRAKISHKAWMRSVYVDPAFRGTGAAKALVQRLIDHGVAHGLTIYSGVIADNEAARRLYLGLGFRPYGLEPRAMFWDGRFHEEVLLVYGAD